MKRTPRDTQAPPHALEASDYGFVSEEWAERIGSHQSRRRALAAEQLLAQEDALVYAAQLEAMAYSPTIGTHHRHGLATTPAWVAQAGLHVIEPDTEREGLAPGDDTYDPSDGQAINTPGNPRHFLTHDFGD